MSVRDVQKVSGEYINFKVTDDDYLLHLFVTLAELRKDRRALVRVAQALFYLPPESGDGS